ncbi:MAG TPA: YqeG family HAD IIIA-type phosphatase [Clostridiaceae bacterium]|nr:YqeG family HAD IIIA-type phosphatase [Clostridiaceae bacterium]
MKKLFEPYAYVNSIFDITPEMLKKNGIYGLILDIDNTLVATNVKEAGEKVYRYIKDLKDSRIKTVIVSNGRKHRVEEFCKPLEIEYIYKAYKPLGRGFDKAIRIMDLSRDQVAVIGDQLFTDVLGGNLKGIRPILIKPIDPDEPIFVRIKRIFEKPFLKKKEYKDKL